MKLKAPRKRSQIDLEKLPAAYPSLVLESDSPSIAHMKVSFFVLTYELVPVGSIPLQIRIIGVRYCVLYHA